MSRTLTALFSDYPHLMRQCKRLVLDEPSELGRQMLERLLNELLDDEMQAHCRAELYERSAQRRDRRNGSYRRALRARAGPLELKVPRARSGRFRSTVVPRFRQVAPELDEGIRQIYLKGVSTRDVGALLEVLCGSRVSASTVSRITRALDAELRRFQARPIETRYVCVMLDGVYLPVKKAQGAARRPLLVAYGIDEHRRRQVIDFRLAQSESEAAWTHFLTSLWSRGLVEEHVGLICTDGGRGLGKALEVVYPLTAHQRCWAHMMRNVVAACPKRLADQVADGARAIYNAPTRRAALDAFKRFRRRWARRVPKAVAKIERALDELLAFFGSDRLLWRALRTTNAIERLFVELRRRLRPMGCLPNAATAQRMSLAVCCTYNARAHRVRPDTQTQLARAA
jgi:putative transposase